MSHLHPIPTLHRSVHRPARLVGRTALALVIGAAAIGGLAIADEAKPAKGENPSTAGAIDPKKNRVAPEWEIHDMKRPKPPVVTPGTCSTQEQAGKAPSDAVVLFGGKDLSKWKSGSGEPTWEVKDDYMEVAGKGGLETKDAYGDCQLHVEWAAPSPAKGEGQGRGNSGIYLNGLYEIQVLDCYKAETYADGQASAVYGQKPPLVNACLPPGQWQTYDIIWHGPRFDQDGSVTRPANVTVLHNGVLTQDHFELVGPSGHHLQPPYKKHPEKGPLSLQNHGSPVRYRNIWIRELKTEEQQQQHAGAPAAGEKSEK